MDTTDDPREIIADDVLEPTMGNHVEIEQLRRCLVSSYKCANSDIVAVTTPVPGTGYINVVYNMKCDNGHREIFSMKQHAN